MAKKSPYLSEDEYDEKIHAPDTYGHLGRNPASEDDSLETEASNDDQEPVVNSDDQENSPISQEEPADTEINDAEDIGEQEATKQTPKEEIDTESNDLLSQLAPREENKPQSNLDRYQQFIDEYKRLQENRRNSDLVSGLVAAGGKIGQSMAGKYSGNFTPDQTGPELIRKMGERPVQNFEQGQVVQGRQLGLKGQMDAADPASSQSQLTRNYLKTRLGIDLPDTVSAADAQMLLKTVGRPTQTKYQKVNGTWTDPDSGESKRISASYDPSAHQYIDQSGKPLPGFLAEGLNPFQSTINPNTGEREIFNKSRGTAPVATGPSKAPALAAAQTPNEVYATISPEVRKELNGKMAPEFNKATEKTRQRLTHVPVIMQRLQEAQTNPAALPQLKAELARFDVGDQRLAQQEFNMFGQRMGYKGVQDWLEAHSTGTISKDFADSMAEAISHVSEDLKGEMNDQAEERANQLIARFPEEAKGVDAGKIAPLIYGGYKPKEEKVRVRNIETGQEGFIPKKNLQKAIASKKYQEIP